jgi:hypothetical protein
MNLLYLFNALIYIACAVSIALAMLKMSGGYRWIHFVSMALCLFFGTVYALSVIEMLPDEKIASFTRPASGLFGLQLATLAWLFVAFVNTRRGGKS